MLMHNFQKITSPNNISEIALHASYMQPGMDLLGGGGCRGVCTPLPSPGQRGCRGGAIFHDKAKHYLRQNEIQ